MKFVYSIEHLEHEPPYEVLQGKRVPAWEVTARAESIRSALEGQPHFESVDPSDHGVAPITATHDPGMVKYLEGAWQRLRADRLQAEAIYPDAVWHAALGARPSDPPMNPLAAAGYWCFDTSTPIAPGTYRAARSAVDVALTAADTVVAGAPVAYGLCRPPGHHAARNVFGGYCYFNNAAITAQWLLDRGAAHVAILDVDFHHGNGTQQLFYDRSDVSYVSIHGDPAYTYPYYTGFADETGSGRGRGANLNLPMPSGTGNDAYLAALGRALDWLSHRPDGPLVVSLGLDTFALDPQCDFAVSTSAYRQMGRLAARAGRPLIVLQEGGYHVPTLGENVREWLLGTVASR